MNTLLKFIAATQFAVVLLVSPSFATASEDVWTACGNQGQNCVIATQDRVLVRYGNLDKNNFFFFGVEGQSEVSCSNFIGNPSHDDSKQCWYNVDSSSIANGNWNKCAYEGNLCNTGTDMPMWVKYGSDATDKWLYTIQDRTFTCDDDHFGWDPDVGTKKSCWVGYPPIYPTQPAWNTCATEGNTCDLTAINYNDTSILIRYGYGPDKAWNYKLATQSDSFDCNNDNFGNPDDGPNKACGVTLYPGPVVATQGLWHQAVNCRECSSTSFTVTWGTKQSSTSTNQVTWSEGVTESVSAGIVIPPESEKSSISSSQNFAYSDSYQTSLTESYDQSSTENCGHLGNEITILYQFQTSSSADCFIGNGQCSSRTRTFDYICYSGDADKVPTPQCLPNACADTYCTECLVD